MHVRIRALALTGLLGGLMLQAAGQAHAQTLELGPLRMTPPDGWVRSPSRTNVSWQPADDPSADSCIIVVTEAVLSDKPREAFVELWGRATQRARGNRPPAPDPKVVDMPGGFKVALGAYLGPFNLKPNVYYAVTNVTDGDAGLAFIGAGTDAKNCHASFIKFLQKLAVVDRGANSASSAGTPALFDPAANIRQDQRIADQRMQDRQTQDRLFQQREAERQAQSRIAQQRLIDSQNQQRIQDANRRR